MLRVIVLLGVALLSACVTPPMSPESARTLKSGKSAVAFYDVTERINYIEDVYLVLGVAQVASESVYSGIWNSNKDLSAMHAEELAKIGVRVRSVYDALSEAEISGFTAMQKELYALNTSGQDTSAIQLKPLHRDLLLQKGFDYLFWLNWSGYTLHIKTLGLPSLETSNTEYWIFDLKKNSLLWHGTIRATDRLRIKGKGKVFLEKDDLSGLKTEVTKLTKEIYKSGTNRGYRSESVIKKIGLE